MKMRSRMRTSIITILFMSLLGLNFVYGEQLTFRTYYPSPFGAYSRLRLMPKEEFEINCTVGSFYVDNELKLLNYCRNDEGGFSENEAFSGEWSSFVFTDTFATTVAELSENIFELKKETTFLRKDVDLLREEVDLLREDTDLLKEEVGKLKSNTEKSLYVLERSIVELSGDLSNSNQIIDKLRAEVAQLKNRLHKH